MTDVATPSQPSSLPPALLSFVAGYVDTLGFVALHGLFTAHVTGNFVLIGSAAVDPSQSTLLKWLAFPAFVLGVGVATLVVRPGAPEGAAGRVLLVLQAALLAAGMFAGACASPAQAAEIAAGMLVAGAMGVQNAAGKLAFSAWAPTTVMTGNVTQVVLDLVALARQPLSPVRGRVARMSASVLAFALGALAGAVAFAGWGFWGLAMPLPILLALAARP